MCCVLAGGGATAQPASSASAKPQAIERERTTFMHDILYSGQNSQAAAQLA